MTTYRIEVTGLGYALFALTVQAQTASEALQQFKAVAISEWLKRNNSPAQYGAFARVAIWKVAH